ncbi:MAG: hypothetical protein CMN32_16510 [Saprospirales bacterium]|nr:hypothetical protein [Saprospirales bacterium]
MPKLLQMGKGSAGLLLWSIIPAAFIGPGTVTTCSKAGASFGLALVWALTFSIIATMVLQEAAARITIASGKTLGQLIGTRYRGRTATWLKVFLFGSAALGCTAYQAGNLLGAVSGLQLVSTTPPKYWLAGLGLVAAILLWTGSIRIITSAMAIIVFLMGLAFVVVGVQAPVSAPALAKSLVVPSFPEGSGLLIIGLIGTTVVPYNLFLGSGLSKGQHVSEMRKSLLPAILIGGIISLAIVLTGAQVSGEFSFAALAATLENGLGPWAGDFFGFGLFAAGISSAITAPFAAAITGQAIFGNGRPNWSTRSRNFRLVWAVVLGAGLLFGLTGVKPIPAIIAAQAANGFLLPIVAIFLWMVVNDRKLLPKRYLNSHAANALMAVVVLIVTGLGLYNLWKVVVGLL